MVVHKTPNRHAKQYVHNKQNFIGSNLMGQWHASGVYVVYSYGHHFPIWVYDCIGGWFGNVDKYSRTTSRHQSQTHPNQDIHWLHTDALLYLVKLGYKQVVTNRVLHGVKYD